MKSLEQLRTWVDLLGVEKKEDWRQYREMVLRKELKERVKKGISWYPVSLEKISIGTGEKIVLELGKPSTQIRGNAMQTGNMVAVFGMNADVEIGRLSGVAFQA